MQNDFGVGRSPWTARDPLIPPSAGQGAGRGRGRSPHSISVGLVALILAVLLFSSLLIAAPKRGEEPQSASELFAAIATDLSQSDSSAFMSHFDSDMPGYDRLYEFIRALCDQDDVGSAIDILKDAGDDHQRAVELDWTLEIEFGKSTDAPVQRREEKVKCKLERRGKRWIVTALDPIAFFTPPSQ